MRNIKFRAWDKELKQMHICGQDVHDSITFNEQNIAQYYNLQNGCGSPTTYELMQYTGLKDKNGKEIYEGDIVLIDKENQIKGQVKYSEQYASFIIVDTNSIADEAENLSCYSEIEVIGNIYDNPDLLEKEGIKDE